MRAFVRHALVLALLGAGCGDRRLDLALALASDSCKIPVPAGGSIMYQLTSAPSGVDSGASAVCGTCLPVGAALADAGALLSFLRANAPACIGIRPDSDLRVALTAYDAGACSDGSGKRLFCSQSATVPLPDGRQDALVALTLTCQATCAGGCQPTTCIALGKNCDMVSDGCGGMLDCGTCSPPEACGGHGGFGTPNVCSK
jgi:hypothetical protein